MSHYSNPIVVAEHQRALLREASQERLARAARRQNAAPRGRSPLAARLGPLLVHRLGRLLPAPR